MRPTPELLRRPAALALDVAVRGLDRVTAALADARRTSAFLAARLRFVPRASDIYVATYPRSGTTWVQFMLYLLTSDGSLSFRHIGQVTPWFERSFAIGSLRPRDVEALPSPRVFKTHLVPSWLPSVGRFVHVERDVVAVASSYYDFYRSHLGFRGSVDDFLRELVAGRLQYGSWHEHTARWHAGTDRRIHRVRYEDLVADTPGELARIADFLELDVSPERIRDVVARARFDEMKRLESKFDHATAVLDERGITPGAFLRRGPDGARSDEVPPAWADDLRSRDLVVRGPIHLRLFLH